MALDSLFFKFFSQLLSCFLLVEFFIVLLCLLTFVLDGTLRVWVLDFFDFLRLGVVFCLAFQLSFTVVLDTV
jgi:hypothetical protein